MPDTPKPATAWQSVLSYVETRINKQTYQTWLRPTRQSARTNGPPVLFVDVPNAEFADWIPEHFAGVIREAMSSLSLAFTDVTYIVPEAPARPAAPPPKLSEALKVQQRKCPAIPPAAWYQWVAKFRDAVARTSEASDNFHYAGFVVAVGAALGRTVYTVMQRPIYPNLFLATIGTSGYAGKSGAMYYPLQLVRHAAPAVTSMHSIDSAEGLIKFMVDKTAADAKRKNSTVLLQLDEMRWLIDKASMRGLGGALLALLNKAYDVPSRLETNPKHGAAGIDEPPALAIYGATTAEDFDRLEASDIAAGLGRRFIYVPGERKPHPVPDPPPPDAELWAEVRHAVKDAVEFWASRGVTEIQRSQESKKIYDDWYRRWFARKHPDELISVLDAGSRVHFRKIELLFAGLDQSFETTAEHSEAAAAFTEFCYDSAQTIFRGFDRSEWAKQEQKIVEMVLAAPAHPVDGPGLWRRQVQRDLHLDGDSFKRRLEAVAGKEGQPEWDGQLRQEYRGHGRWRLLPNYDYL